MQTHRIEFTKSAKREFYRLPKVIQNKVIEALQYLSQNVFSELLHIKKLKGAEDLYRIRIGDYRVVYEVSKTVLLVVVIKIGHRKDVYRIF